MRCGEWMRECLTLCAVWLHAAACVWSRKIHFHFSTLILYYYLFYVHVYHFTCWLFTMWTSEIVSMCTPYSVCVCDPKRCQWPPKCNTKAKINSFDFQIQFFNTFLSLTKFIGKTIFMAIGASLNGAYGGMWWPQTITVRQLTSIYVNHSGTNAKKTAIQFTTFTDFSLRQIKFDLRSVFVRKPKQSQQ